MAETHAQHPRDSVPPRPHVVVRGELPVRVSDGDHEEWQAALRGNGRLGGGEFG